jgi:hypothetical protein
MEWEEEEVRKDEERVVSLDNYTGKERRRLNRQDSADEG